jgi:hypothetical protein
VRQPVFHPVKIKMLQIFIKLANELNFGLSRLQ